MTDTTLSSAEYRLLVEQAPIMIWRADTSAGCDYFNERWLAFTGRTMAQEMGNGWAEGVHPEDFQRCLDIYLTAFSQQVTFEMEYRLRRHDGQYRWLFDRGVPIFDEDSTFLGYTGSCIDVHERIEAREALRLAQERELQQLRGLIPICAWCRKVREDGGFWTQVEVYISRRSQADFTHSICPDCQARMQEGEAAPPAAAP